MNRKATHGHQPIRNEFTGISVDFSDLRNLLKKLENNNDIIMLVNLPMELNNMTKEQQHTWFIEKANEHHELGDFYKQLSQLNKKLKVVDSLVETKPAPRYNETKA